MVDENVRFGVSTDEGNGPGWPNIRAKLLAADIVVLAELSETDADGRPTMSGKVAIVAVVGNEDGAHHVVAKTRPAMNDVG